MKKIVNMQKILNVNIWGFIEYLHKNTPRKIVKPPQYYLIFKYGIMF